MQSVTRDSFILLYVFVRVRNRLPYSNETFLKKNLGAWAVKVRAWELNNQLSREQLRALAKIPLWPKNPNAVQQGATEKTPLITTAPSLSAPNSQAPAAHAPPPYSEKPSADA